MLFYSRNISVYILDTSVVIVVVVVVVVVVYKLAHRV